jgi:hypothetical protein
MGGDGGEVALRSTVTFFFPSYLSLEYGERKPMCDLRNDRALLIFGDRSYLNKKLATL